jgi:hypothetical protein
MVLQHPARFPSCGCLFLLLWQFEAFATLLTSSGGEATHPLSAENHSSCFMVGWAWSHQNDGSPPECIFGLTDVSVEDQPYTRGFIGLGPETSGTTALLDYLSRDNRVVGVGERDFFSWDQHFRQGMASYLAIHRRAYERMEESMANPSTDTDEFDEYGDQEFTDHEGSGSVEGSKNPPSLKSLPALEEMVFAEKSPLYG